jgi:membrane-bound ClpP family serine protease
MNKTQIIGGFLLVIGLITNSRFPNKGFASVAILLGAFVLWNGWVANYNDDISFAFFG